MLRFAIIACVMLWSSFAEAMTWDFDDGTTQGWAAKTGNGWGGTFEFDLFPGVVEDGVWTIDVSPSVVGVLPSPSVEVGEIAPDDREVWEGLLRDIRLNFHLDWGEGGTSVAAD